MNQWNQYEVIAPQIRKNLVSAGYEEPTEVQKEVFSKYNRNQHFIIASQTGSGKTLAFAIPLISEMLLHLPYFNWRRSQGEITCLILTPTRELAVQIHAHLNKVLPEKELQIGCLLGGMSKDKQKRILSRVPHILLATPGRLWDFIENEQCEALTNLNKLKFLVIDEADRMVELGHFPDLDKIIIKLTSPSQVTHDKQKIAEAMKEANSGSYLNGKEINFEMDKPIEMDYKDFLKLQNKTNNNDEEEYEDVEEAEEEVEQEEIEDENIENIEEVEVEQEDVDPSYRPSLRTFLVSATLTQQFKQGSKFKFLKHEKDTMAEQSEPLDRKSRKLEKEVAHAVPKLQSLLGKLKIKVKPVVIDLTQNLVFPEQMLFYKSLVEEDDKLLYLYNYLKENEGQTFIIFLNSITYSNKVSSMLKVLNLKSVTLHSQQQQRQRLKRLDKFTKREVNILVCTDVAARGLDIVGVENVVHYQIPFSADTFVHRCGRTARINKEGKTLLLIGPKDMLRYTRQEEDLIKSGIKIREYKLNWTQINEYRNIISQAQDLEKETHALQKKTIHKEHLQRQIDCEDFDIEAKELKRELEQVEEEIITKKRKLMSQQKDYKQTISQKNKLESTNQRRRNALFLGPQDIAKLQDQLKNYKEQQLYFAEKNKKQEEIKKSKEEKQVLGQKKNKKKLKLQKKMK